MLWVIDAFKLVHSVNAEKKLIFLCLFLTLLSALCLQAIHLGHIYSVYCDLQRPPLAKINFNFYVNEKRMKKKNEFNGDVAWFLKRMESAWCKRTIMEELFFFKWEIGKIMHAQWQVDSLAVIFVWRALYWSVW